MTPERNYGTTLALRPANEYQRALARPKSRAEAAHELSFPAILKPDGILCSLTHILGNGLSDVFLAQLSRWMANEFPAPIVSRLVILFVPFAVDGTCGIPPLDLVDLLDDLMEDCESVLCFFPPWADFPFPTGVFVEVPGGHFMAKRPADVD